MPAARIVVTCVALLALVGCADDDGGGGGASDGDLEGITWILDPASAAGLGDAPDGASATIRFDEGRAGGTAFCNTFGGGYEAGADGSLTIEVGAMTEMACDEPLMALETAYTVALGQITSYEAADDALTLRRDGGASLTFTAEQPLPLVGTEWRLDGVAAGADAVSSTLAGTEATATFDEEGRVGGVASCNRYGGSYTTDGDAIVIEDVMSTAMACEPDVMEQERLVLEGLRDAATYGIAGSTLTLSDADGAFLLSFVAA